MVARGVGSEQRELLGLIHVSLRDQQRAVTAAAVAICIMCTIRAYADSGIADHACATQEGTGVQQSGGEEKL